MSSTVSSPSARQLVAQLSTGESSAVDLLTEFRQRIDAVNPSLNALVVTRWDEAFDEARRADQAADAGHPLGPLHGLPITIKEMFDVAGLPTTAGIQTLSAIRVTRDAEVVRRLRAAGAIVMGKTNVPQMGMMAETDNPVFGRTNNPWDTDRGPGGSSGGEAALIAAGASPLGLGSDGGGSIRQPSHVCGICGFKPTGGRLPMQGHWLSANWPGDWVQPGPMARTVDDLQLAYSVLRGQENVATVYGEVPGQSTLSDQELLSGLRVGVYEELEDLPATATVRRAVREAADALAAVGVEIVPFQWDCAAEIWNLYTSIFYAEGLRDMKRQCRGSVLDSRVQQYFQLTRLPGWLRRPAAWIGDRMGQKHVAETLRTLKRPVASAEEYCRFLSRLQGFRHRFSQMLNRAKVQALLGPAGPITAFPHGEFYANYSLIYTGIYNLLGVPAGVVPATRVRPDEVASDPPPRDWVDLAMWKAQNRSEGLPAGVQIVGRWWCDDQVLALMGLLENQLSTKPDFPRVPPPGPGCNNL